MDAALEADRFERLHPVALATAKAAAEDTEGRGGFAFKHIIKCGGTDGGAVSFHLLATKPQNVENEKANLRFSICSHDTAVISFPGYLKKITPCRRFTGAARLLFSCILKKQNKNNKQDVLKEFEQHSRLYQPETVFAPLRVRHLNSRCYSPVFSASDE